MGRPRVTSGRSALESSFDVGPADLVGWLTEVQQAAEAAETGLFSVIPVLGEPSAQRAVDDWVDHAVDLWRALAEGAQEVSGRARLLDGTAEHRS